MPELTLVMPTSGRQEFSLRFVQFAHAQKADCDIVSEDSKDENFSAYYAKVNRLIGQVKTPYAMMVDNDDLIVWPTLRKCVAFLNGNPDYAAAGGAIWGFKMRGNKPYGPLDATRRFYSPYDKPETYDEDKDARIIKGFANSWTFYAVHRTEVLATIWREIAEMDLSDMQLHEKFCAMRLLSLGKVFGSPKASYLRQYGTSGDFKYRNDFPMRLLTNQFARDRDAMLDRLDMLPGNRTRLIRAWADWWDAWLTRNYGPAATMRKWVKARFPRAAAVAKELQWRLA